MGATLVDDDDTMESIFQRADRLLYRSKAAGRNRLTVA
jgi:PleD family two-component response regulator